MPARKAYEKAHHLIDHLSSKTSLKILTGFCAAGALSSDSAGQLNMCSESHKQFCLDWNSLRVNRTN